MKRFIGAINFKDIKNIAFLLSFFVLGLTLNSCKNEPSELTKTEILTEIMWKIKSKAISPSFEIGGITISDIMVLESDEERDYTYKYNADGTVVRYSSTNQLISQTTWSFNSGETEIIFNPAIQYVYPVIGQMGLPSMNLVSLSENEMKTTVGYTYEGLDYIINIVFHTI